MSRSRTKVSAKPSGTKPSRFVMTRDHVIWAGALWVEKHYGEEGYGFISKRIGSLVLEDDIVGVEMWQKIAAALEQLSTGRDSRS